MLFTENSQSISSIIWCYLNKFINFRMGLIAGCVTGSIVFVINYEHGFLPALASFWKQFGFNLLLGGYNTKTCEKLALRIENTILSLILATIIPTTQAFAILYSIHYFGGTPKAMESTLWQVWCNLIVFLFFALVYRDIIDIKRPTVSKIFEIFKLSKYLRKRRYKQIIIKRKIS